MLERRLQRVVEVLRNDLLLADCVLDWDAEDVVALKGDHLAEVTGEDEFSTLDADTGAEDAVEERRSTPADDVAKDSVAYFEACSLGDFLGDGWARWQDP